MAEEDISFDPFFARHEDETQGVEESSFFERNRGVNLTWDSLGYTVRAKRSMDKVIIHGISGEVRPGQMVAIMGSSGAGKTTLLNLLAGRLTTSSNFVTSGSIRMNGLPRKPRVFRRLSAYVEQDDKLFAELTVEEQIRFSAYLRLPKSMTNDERETRVNETIQELGLSRVRNSQIGNEIIRGVSGGERKRVNVGVELVADPSLIFLDEPTSGLDSFNALNVMYSLRKLASAGRAVVSTIHQPRSNIFQLFDVLCLLSQGRLMYFGPAAGAITYFSSISFNCPMQFNPADYFIDLLSVDPRSPELESRSKRRIEFLGDVFQNYAREKPLHITYSPQQIEENAVQMAELEKAVKYQSSWGREFGLLLKRSFQLMAREKTANIARFVQVLIFSILLGVIWLNIGRGDNSVPSNFRALTGVLFFAVVNQAFGATFGVLFNYPAERAIVLKERASASYRVSSYFLAKTVSELPRGFLFSFLFSVITYWMIGLRANGGSFFLFVLVLFLVNLIAETGTYCISTITPDAQTAAAIVPVFVIMSMLFAGFFIPPESIPAGVSWIKWISFIYYAFYATVDNQFQRDFPQQLQFEQPFTRTVGVFGLLGIVVVLRFLQYVILRKKGPRFSLVESSEGPSSALEKDEQGEESDDPDTETEEEKSS
uniref:Probable ATP-dependent transporter ycf16 n=1 Tax=Compsopogon caeruleus TaxID=31354 RepID=A0A7S1THM9_9RHOD|mmetsp:Transcript_7402/g.15102  ORF Transcript_7402/g.15102 Transcript_7402/m.15102 type:complete len:655 (+) Transcript_7402:328-2292(+)|eukprot:CAMPEP_0184677456 /NCGR_PEP_ID=MMETSP0312-20130426/51_1 /TAXON_ID=31354 /ORGANISM="Compsopogon coeruleus, Strain SAG 36.94" /LENGTH=654 /DNA_ID=CAMNT_0027125361 /DNA_START=258 /DNA_END=2222 /DNA_ORIENTATION=+